VRSTLDVVYGVQRGGHRKKSDEEKAAAKERKRQNKLSKNGVSPSGDDDTLSTMNDELLYSKDRIQMVPLGQDKDRKRYWAVDGELVPSPMKRGLRFIRSNCA